MGIYFSNIRSILEVKRKVNGQEEDLDQEENNQEEPEDNNEDNQGSDEENNEEDEHADPGEASDYSMEVDDDEDNNDNEDSEDDQSNSEDDPEDSANDGDEHADPGDSSDYSMDVDDSEDGEDSDNNDDSSEDSESDDTTTDSEGGDNELKSLEDDIFKDVPPEQMNIKIMELKKQYLEVYATITDVLTRCNKIPKTTHNMKVVEFIVNKLVEFKELVNFYLSNTFDTKTYVENMVNYQQYLATLNTINKLLKEINTKKENNS